MACLPKACTDRSLNTLIKSALSLNYCVSLPSTARLKRAQPPQQCFPFQVGNWLRTFTMHVLCMSHAAFNKYCNQREQHGPLQPKPLRQRQRLSQHSKHVAWPCGRDVVAAVHAVAGAGFDPIVNHGTRDSSVPHFHPRRLLFFFNSKTLEWGNQVGSKLSLRMYAAVRCIDGVLAHSI